MDNSEYTFFKIYLGAWVAQLVKRLSHTSAPPSIHFLRVVLTFGSMLTIKLKQKELGEELKLEN